MARVDAVPYLFWVPDGTVDMLTVELMFLKHQRHVEALGALRTAVCVAVVEKAADV